MSQDNVAGQSLTAGEYAEDYAAFEAQRQPRAAARAEEKATEGTDAGQAGEEPESAGAKTDPPEDKTTEQTDEAEDEAEPEEKPKKKGGWQRKIERAERENAELRSRLAAVEGKLAGDKPAEGKPGDKAAGSGEAQTYSGKPKPVAANFDTYEAYTEALADWKLDEREAKRDIETRQRTAQETRQGELKKFVERADAVKGKYADWDEVVESDLEISPAVQACMMRSEHGPEIGYWLAKNPAEAERISNLHPIDAAREIGKLETRFAKSEEAPKPKPVTKAPDPIKPVSRSSSAAKAIDDVDIPYSEYEKQANKRFVR